MGHIEQVALKITAYGNKMDFKKSRQVQCNWYLSEKKKNVF